MPTRGTAAPIAWTTALLSGLALLSSCGSDGLQPDFSVDVTDDRPPATDTRTVDPPTYSNLPVTRP